MLDSLLSSILEMSIPQHIVWELLIVDNNSTDDTRMVAEHYNEKLPLTYISETKQGKCFALNHSIKKAKGDLLLFCDDDVIVEPDWLSAFVEAAENRGYSWFGGRVKPNWKNAKPPWYREETVAAFRGYFGDYDLGESSRVYKKGDKLPLGASLAIRREVFDKIGEFRLDLGPRGKLRGVGDETDFLERAIAAGFKGWYVGNTKVLHYVGKERLSLVGYVNYGLGKGINQYKMGVEKNRQGTFKVACWQLVRGMIQLLKGRGDRMRLCLINYGIEMGRRRAKREKPFL